MNTFKWIFLGFWFISGMAQAVPNFVFILVDDMGWGDMRRTGSSLHWTQRLDDLAREGTLFTNAYTASPVCSPARASFMTGRFPASLAIHTAFSGSQVNIDHGMPDYLDPDLPNITATLKAAGYATGHYGKWHLSGWNPPEGTPDPGAYGIDEHITEISSGPHFDRNPEPEFFMARSTTMITDEAVAFIERHQAEPFYLNVWYMLPHAVLNPTDEQIAPFALMMPGPNAPNERGANAIYAAAIEDIDTNVGRIMDMLDDLGLSENTVLIFASDNGPEVSRQRTASHSAAGIAGPFRGNKRSLYEGGIRTPLIVRWLGHTPARVVDDDAIIHAVDLFPTILDITGVAHPLGFTPDGESVKDILLGSTRTRTTPLFWEWRFENSDKAHGHSPRLAMRLRDWKLLMNPDESRVELYNVKADFMEVKDRADIPNFVAQRNTMKAMLLDWYHCLPDGPTHPTNGKINYRWPSWPN